MMKIHDDVHKEFRFFVIEQWPNNFIPVRKILAYLGAGRSIHMHVYINIEKWTRQLINFINININININNVAQC